MYSLKRNPDDCWTVSILCSHQCVFICNITGNEHDVEHCFYLWVIERGKNNLPHAFFSFIGKSYCDSTVLLHSETFFFQGVSHHYEKLCLPECEGNPSQLCRFDSNEQFNTQYTMTQVLIAPFPCLNPMLWAGSQHPNKGNPISAPWGTALAVCQQVEMTVTFGLSYRFSGNMYPFTTVCFPLEANSLHSFVLTFLTLFIFLFSFQFLPHTCMYVSLPASYLFFLINASSCFPWLVTPPLPYRISHYTVPSDLTSSLSHFSVSLLSVMPQFCTFFPCLWWECKRTSEDTSSHLQPTLLPLLHKPGICALVWSPVPGPF